MNDLMQDILRGCRSLPVVSLEANQTILAEGDRTGLIYILIEGEVRVSKRELEIIRLTEPGSILGEMSALLDLPHTATVTTLAPSRFYRVENQPGFLRNNTDICYPLAVLLARRVNGVTNYLVDIKEQFSDQSNHLSMMDEILATIVNQQGEDPQPGSDRDPA